MQRTVNIIRTIDNRLKSWKLTLNPLFNDALENDDADQFQMILDRNDDIWFDNKSYFQYTILENKWSILKFLLDRYPNKKGFGLIMCVKCDNIPMAKFFLDSGVDVCIRQNEALLVSIRHHCLEMVELLIARGADINYNGIALETCISKDYLDIMELLLAAGADININEGRILQFCIRCGKDSMIKFLLENGADIHIKHDDMLRYSIGCRKNDITKLLLEAGIDVHANHDEPMKTAIKEINPDIIKLLISYGVDPVVVIDNYNDHDICARQTLEIMIDHGMPLDKLLLFYLSCFTCS